MRPVEAVALTAYIKAHFPSQPINEYTPEALAELLAPYSVEDCRTAVLTLSTRPGEGSRWCAPSDVVREVKRVRAKRIADVGDLTPPPDLTDAEERAWLRETRRQIGDGLPAPAETRELRPRHLPDLKALMTRQEATR